jgi:phosphopantetheine adenylyltransferase
VRETAKELLVKSGSLNFCIDSLKRYNSNPVNATRAKIMETGDLPSVFRLGHYNGNEDINSSTVTPSPDSDPYNLKYYASKQYQKFANRYGIPAKVQPPLPISILQQIEDQGNGSSSKSTEESNEAYGWVLALDCTTILRECVKKCLPQAQESLEALLATIEASVAKDLPNQERRVSVVENNDVGTIVHLIGVYSNLILALDGQCDKIESYSTRMRQFITTCSTYASELRNNLFSDLEDGFFFYNDQVDIPILGADQYNSLMAVQRERQDATDEVVKNGRTEKLVEIEGRKSGVDEMMDYKSVQLDKMVMFALHGMSGLAVYLSLSSACSEDSLVNGFSFICQFLDNEHRFVVY